MATAKQEKFTADAIANTAKISKVFFAFLGPGIFATLTTSIYVMVDTIIIGQYENEAGLLALNIVLPLYSLFMGIGVLLGVGGGVHFSIAKARGDMQRAKKVFCTSFISLIILLGTLMILANAFFTPLLRVLGADDSNIGLVSSYARYITLGAPALVLAMFLQAFIRNDGNPKLCMFAVIAGGCINIVLDYVFVFVAKMGMSGAALATIISYTINCIILCTHFFRKNCNMKLGKKPSPRLALDICGAGIPSFIAEISTGLVIFVFNRQLLTYMGSMGVVVYGVISNVAIVGMSLFNGVAQSCQPIISACHGAGRADRIKKVAFMGAITAVIIGVGVMLFGEISPLLLVNLFTSAPTETLLALAPKAVRIYFAGMLFCSLNLFIIVYFQATVKQKTAFLLSLMRGVALCSLLVLVLPLIFGGGVIWFVMPITEFITLTAGATILLIYKLKNKKLLLR